MKIMWRRMRKKKKKEEEKEEEKGSENDVAPWHPTAIVSPVLGWVCRAGVQDA